MAEQFTERVEILDDASEVRIELDGINGDITVKDASQTSILDSSGVTFRLEESVGVLTFKDRGTNIFSLIVKPRSVTDSPTVSMFLGNVGTPGRLILTDATPAVVHERIDLDGESGKITIRDSERRDVLQFNSQSAVLDIGAEGNEGDIRVRDNAGIVRIHLDGNSGNVRVRDGNGRDVFHLDSGFAVLDIGAEGNEGDIRVRDNAGNVRIHLDGNDGDIKLSGADCAEEFDIIASEGIEPGCVMVIDKGGKLRQSTKAYDKRVAGIISGAGDARPGIVLDKKHCNRSQYNRMSIALTGKVYCKVDAQYSRIEVGDLLTTSPTLGHAMKAYDPTNAFGAVVGKALQPLHTGHGLIPILIALQ